MWCKAYFNILNRLVLAHESDRQTDSLIAICHATMLHGQKQHTKHTSLVTLSQQVELSVPFTLIHSVTSVQHVYTKAFHTTEINFREFSCNL